MANTTRNDTFGVRVHVLSGGHNQFLNCKSFETKPPKCYLNYHKPPKLVVIAQIQMRLEKKRKDLRPKSDGNAVALVQPIRLELRQDENAENLIEMLAVLLK